MHMLPPHIDRKTVVVADDKEDKKAIGAFITYHHSVEAYHHQGAKLDVRPRVGSSDRDSWPSQAVDGPDAPPRNS